MKNGKPLNATEMTNKNMKVTQKTKTRKGKSQQFPNSLKSTKNNDVSHTQDTNIRRSQQGRDKPNSSNNTSVTNAFNLTFIGHSINGFGSDLTFLWTIAQTKESTL
ncbi:hypothetical protein C1646_777676 [Rhizophagus diaphanus]|nr:hypothetical protein C1646_777676 [Rhizophagus diaphanus] [Rhizophagus sp. MUCL 43196]